MIKVLLKSGEWDFIAIFELAKIVAMLLDSIIRQMDVSVVDILEAVSLWACSNVSLFEPVALVVAIYLG